ncbi:MAG: SIS domain-containing protein [bacterium]
MKDSIIGYFEESANVKLGWVNRYHEKIAAVICLMIDCLRSGNKILFFGNGGSAADAQHLAAELVNRLQFDRPALPAISVATDTSILTCIANDSDFSQIFSRQIESLGKSGDLAVGISASGNSANVVNGIRTASEKGLHTVAFTGNDGGELLSLADHALVVNSDITSIIQEVHITMGHVICKIVEEALFPENDPDRIA